MVVVSHIQLGLMMIHHVHERLRLLFQFWLHWLSLLLAVVYIATSTKRDLINKWFRQDIIEMFERMNFPCQAFREILQEQMKFIHLTPFHCRIPLRKNLHLMNRLYHIFEHDIKKSLFWFYSNLHNHEQKQIQCSLILFLLILRLFFLCWLCFILKFIFSVVFDGENVNRRWEHNYTYILLIFTKYFKFVQFLLISTLCSVSKR